MGRATLDRGTIGPAPSHVHPVQEKLINDSATDIQRCYRGHRARERVRAIRAELLRIKRENSALRIQRNYRGHVGRKVYRQR